MSVSYRALRTHACLRSRFATRPTTAACSFGSRSKSRCASCQPTTSTLRRCSRSYSSTTSCANSPTSRGKSLAQYGIFGDGSGLRNQKSSTGCRMSLKTTWVIRRKMVELATAVANQSTTGRGIQRQREPKEGAVAERGNGTRRRNQRQFKLLFLLEILVFLVLMKLPLAREILRFCRRRSALA